MANFVRRKLINPLGNRINKIKKSLKLLRATIIKILAEFQYIGVELSKIK